MTGWKIDIKSQSERDKFSEEEPVEAEIPKVDDIEDSTQLGD